MAKKLPEFCQDCDFKYADSEGVEWCKDINGLISCEGERRVT